MNRWERWLRHVGVDALGRDAGARTVMVLAAMLLTTGTLLLGTSISGAATNAKAVPTITVTPSTGLTNGQVVTITGSGFAKNSIGNVLECNGDASQPTVALGAPVNSSIAVGCTGPSYSLLVTTSATGTISTTYHVIQGTVGPPCGSPSDVITTCATDSAGNSAAADAALYPCPPTPAEQAKGDVCTLTYGDQSGDSGFSDISFGSTTTTTGATTTSTSSTSTTSTPTSTTSTSSTTTSSTPTSTTSTSTPTSTTSTSTTSTSTTSTTSTTVAPTTTTTVAPTTTTTVAPTTTTTVAPTTTTTVAGTTTTTAVPTSLTGAYELFCPNTPVGDIALNDAETTATVTPSSGSSVTAGSTFNVTNYQTVVNLPAQIVTAAAALGNSSIAGTATAQVDATGATPATVSVGPLTISVPIPSPVPDAGVSLSLPSTPQTVGPFTATTAAVTIQEDSAASLTLDVSGSNLSLTCNAYPNNSVATGITTSTPPGNPIAPVIAIANGGSQSTTTVPPVTTTTKAPATSPGGNTTTPPTTPVNVPSSQLAFTGPGPGVGMLGVVGGVLVLLGFALLALVDAPRRAMARLVVLGPDTVRRLRRGELRWDDLRTQMPARTRRLLHDGVRTVRDAGSWLLGR